MNTTQYSDTLVTEWQRQGILPIPEVVVTPQSTVSPKYSGISGAKVPLYTIDLKNLADMVPIPQFEIAGIKTEWLLIGAGLALVYYVTSKGKK